ncbi:Imm21 family immunity protein [Herbidospora cretacea]|uniref:Imm21 family immunity protein n=1 Tax=Herbidospora cretacea TaxID=28444 RepID=UPI000772E97A|nr:Imm21 family immunity protein [Herbidospora cretacea]
MILGDEPATTTFIPSISAFVRWIYADHHTDVQALLEGALDDVEWTEGPIFDVTGPLVLFDAGESGLGVVPEEIDEQYGDSREGFDALRFDIAPGLHRVRYADVHPGERTCFGVCRLVPLEN